MNDFFIIYLDRLKGSQEENLIASVPPSFLDCGEKELQFNSLVEVKGKAYIVDEHLVIRLSASTKASLPCSICNQMIDIPIKINNFYHTKPLEECPSVKYDFSGALREQILLETPPYAECSGGCSERDSVKKFMKQETSSSEENPHFPFSGLDDSTKIGDNNHGST